MMVVLKEGVRANLKTVIPRNVIVRISNLRCVIAFVYFAFPTIQTFDTTRKHNSLRSIKRYLHRCVTVLHR